MEWISVNERLPPDENRVLVNSAYKIGESGLFDGESVGIAFYSRFYSEGDWWNYDKNRTPAQSKNGRNTSVITHWMPLPKSPSDDMQQQQHQHDQEDGSYTSSAVIANPRPHAETTNAKH